MRKCGVFIASMKTSVTSVSMNTPSSGAPFAPTPGRCAARYDRPSIQCTRTSLCQFERLGEERLNETHRRHLPGKAPLPTINTVITRGNGLMVEVDHLLALLEVFQEQRASYARAQPILVIGDAEVLVVRLPGDGLRGCLGQCPWSWRSPAGRDGRASLSALLEALQRTSGGKFHRILGDRLFAFRHAASCWDSRDGLTPCTFVPLQFPKTVFVAANLVTGNAGCRR